MGTEYYLIQPEIQEKYYLGKGNWGLVEPINHTNENFIQAEDYEELFLEMLKAEPFSELYVEQVRDLAYDIYEWCEYPMFIINDCSDNFSDYDDYKETGSILNVWAEFKKRYEPLFNLEEELSDLILMIPSEYYVVDKYNVILSIATLKNYIKERQNA